MILIEDRKTAGKFLLTNSIRIAVLFGLLIISGFVELFFKTPFPSIPIIVSLSLAVGFSLFNFYLIRVLSYKLAIYIQIAVDIMVVTLLVYFSGGIVSPFYFLYILPIIVAALFLKRNETVYVAAFAFIVFGILADMMYMKILPPYPGILLPEVTFGSFIYNILMSFIAFSSVALITSHYFEKVRTADEKLRNVQENLEDLVQLNNIVLEKMQNGFVTCDLSGKVISYNKIARDLLDLSTQKNLFSLLFAGDETKNFPESMQDGQKYYYEIDFNRLHLGISVTMLADLYALDRVLVFIITDLTEKRKIELELQQRDHLALIGEMAAGLAHEIRNPLASISGSVQFLKKELSLDSEYHHLMEIIVKESARLSKSIEDFLDFTSSSPLNIEQINLSGLVDDVIELMKNHHLSIDFVQRYEPRIMIRGDAEKMTQVLWNLLNNAAKAVGDLGEVTVEIFPGEGEVRLIIRDNGTGMSPVELEKVFDPFYSGFTSGIGLGMPLVKRIIEEHGFSIAIDSRKNMGTEVKICIPIQ